MDINQRIKDKLCEMTKSEMKIAAHYFENVNDFAFDTLDSVAEKINTSTTSVIRFCRKLGYSGYKPFQDEIRSAFKSELTLPDKLKRTIIHGSGDVQLSKTVANAMVCIENTFNNLPSLSVHNAVSAIVNADRVFCFGLKESHALAHYAYTRFLTVRDNTFMLTAGHSGEVESVLSIGEDDVCICFLFHRYTKQSPQILRLLKERGATVILITSSPYESVEKNCSILLPCDVDIGGIKNSAVAPICIIDHLCNASAVSMGDKTLKYMQESEKLFEDFVF